MPSRNTVKVYLENTYYHIYNRGIEGRDIFRKNEDYKAFLSFIKRYLTTASQNEVRPRWKIDLPKKILLAGYCLMPNHLHLLVKQTTKDGMTLFMRALMDSYVRYFNQKYKRYGSLFQGKFRAIHVDREEYLLHLSRYIHLNPLDLEGMTTKDLENYYCSYGEYIGKRKTSWVRHEEILDFFSSKLKNMGSYSSYRDFVVKYQASSGELLGRLTLE